MGTNTEQVKPQELIEVSSKPAVLEFNFAYLKEALAKDLKRYDVIVTVEGIKDAKKLATEINKRASALDTTRKLKVKEVSGPIKIFDIQMKELVTMHKDGRQKLLAQVAKFEAETKIKVIDLLKTERAILFESFEVQEEFRTAEFEDLIRITNMTSKEKLTSSAKEKIKIRVTQDKAAQDRVKFRIIELENRSFKAGLSAPLTEAHVIAFLKDDDAAYDVKLNRIMSAEIIRQKQAEEKIRNDIAAEQERKKERAEREREKEAQARLKEEQEKSGYVIVTAESFLPEEEDVTVTVEPEENTKPFRREIVSRYDTTGGGQSGPVERGTPPETPKSPPQEQQAPRKEPVPDGKIRFIITAQFDVTAPPSVSNEKIESLLREKMKAAGITSLSSLRIDRDA